MASTIYNGSASVTTAYASSDIYTLAVSTSSITNISQQGSSVVIQTGSTAFTITGVTLAQLTNANFALQGGGMVQFGDGTSGTVADQFANTLNGTANDDILMGLGGNDSITAGNGNNLVFGGSAVTDTTDGNDIITSGTGNDTIYGNAGADNITSGGGSDLVYGGIGTDTITTNALTGNASVYGGGGFIDTVDGADNITVASSTGNLFLTGNAGTDTITVTTSSGNASVYGGLGADTINVTSTAGNNEIAGGSGPGTSSDVDNITFTGTGAANVTIYGGTTGTDTNDGVDNINATVAGGTAMIFGNAGNDVINLQTDGAASVYGGLGTDNITITSTAATTARVNVFAGPSDAGGTDIVDVTGMAAGTKATVYGGNGLIDAADGADRLLGGASDDTIYGNGGNDYIRSGDGNNTLYGGAGSDTFNVNLGAGTGESTTIADYNAPTETVLVGSILANSFTAASANASAISFTGTADTLNILGTTSTSGTVFSGWIDANNDGIVAGADGMLMVNTSTTGTALIGGANNDMIFGNSGNDSIIDGAGSDTIYGGAGNDTIALAADAVTDDVFFTSTGDGVDQITGFVSTVDNIRFGGGLQTANDDGTVAGTLQVTSATLTSGTPDVIDITNGTGTTEAFVISSAENGVVTAANLTSLAAVATEINIEATITNTTGNGADMLVVLESSDVAGTFGVYQYTEATGDTTVSASELTLLGVVTGNAVVAGDFSF